MIKLFLPLKITDDAYVGTADDVGVVAGTCGAIAVCKTGFCTCVDFTDCIIIGECVFLCQEPIILFSMNGNHFCLSDMNKSSGSNKKKMLTYRFSGRHWLIVI